MPQGKTQGTFTGPSAKPLLSGAELAPAFSGAAGSGQDLALVVLDLITEMERDCSTSLCRQRQGTHRDRGSCWRPSRDKGTVVPRGDRDALMDITVTCGKQSVEGKQR